MGETNDTGDCPACEGVGHLGPATGSKQADYGRTCPACEGTGRAKKPVDPDGTVRLPDAIESWLDGHFEGEMGDDADELDAARNSTAVALWSLIYRQGDSDTDEAAIAAFVEATHIGS